VSTLDFDKVPTGHEVSLKVEKSESEGDAKLRRVKDLALFFFALIGVVLLLGLCVYVSLTTTSPEDKRWSTSILTAIVGGLVGYLVKK
jgi:hypothetical protein